MDIIQFMAFLFWLIVLHFLLTFFRGTWNSGACDNREHQGAPQLCISQVPSYLTDEDTEPQRSHEISPRPHTFDLEAALSGFQRGQSQKSHLSRTGLPRERGVAKICSSLLGCKRGQGRRGGWPRALLWYCSTLKHQDLVRGLSELTSELVWLYTG